MRLKVTVRRHNLPDTPIIWTIQNEDSTISQIIEQINEVVPLESGSDWGLEDYAFELVSGTGAKGFECLHFQTANQVLKDGDEVVVRPLLSQDVKQRRVSGRHQIAVDGRHLIDGVAFGGRMKFGTWSSRPPVDIPPRKRRRITYQQPDDQDSDNEGDRSDQGDDEAPPMLMASEDSNTGKEVAIWASFDDAEANAGDDEQDENDDYQASDLEDDDEMDIPDLADELQALEEEAEEVDRPSDAENHIDALSHNDAEENLFALRAAFPKAPKLVCEKVLTESGGDLGVAWDALWAGFASAQSKRSMLRGVAERRIVDQSRRAPLKTLSKAPATEFQAIYETPAAVAADAEDEEEVDSEMDPDEQRRLKHYDQNGLAAGSIGDIPLTTKPKIIFSDSDNGSPQIQRPAPFKLTNDSDDESEDDQDFASGTEIDSDDSDSQESSDSGQSRSIPEQLSKKGDFKPQAPGNAKASKLLKVFEHAQVNKAGEVAEGRRLTRVLPVAVASNSSDSTSYSRLSEDVNTSSDGSDSSSDGEAEPKTSKSVGVTTEQASGSQQNDDDTSDDSSDDSETEEESSSSGSGEDESSSDSDSDSAPEQTSSKVKSPLATVQPVIPTRQPVKTTAPGKGLRATQARNERRRNHAALLKLQQQGLLPQTTTITEFKQLNLNEISTLEAAELALAIIRAGKTAPSEDNVSDKPTTSSSKRKAVTEAKAFEARRAELLASLASGGVLVDEDISLTVSGEPVLINGRTRPEAIPSTEGTLHAALVEGEGRRRAKLDVGASRRLLFGNLGIKTPKNKAEEQKVKDDLMKLVKPMKVVLPEAASVEIEDEDPDAWRTKINLRAVECCYEGVVYSEPPFPFVQRWDPQQRNWHKKHKPKKNVSVHTLPQADDNLSLQKHTEVMETSEDSYYDTTEIPDIQMDGTANAQTGVAGADDVCQHLNVSNPDDDLPILPDDMSTLEVLRGADLQPGAVIAFKQLILSEATQWQPQMSGYRTAVISKAISVSEVEMYLAKRDREDPEKHYDEYTGKRLYGKFETYDDEEDEDDFVDDGHLVASFAELVDAKIVQAAPVDLAGSNRSGDDPAIVDTPPAEDILNSTTPNAQVDLMISMSGMDTLFSNAHSTSADDGAIQIDDASRLDITNVIGEAGVRPILPFSVAELVDLRIGDSEHAVGTTSSSSADSLPSSLQRHEEASFEAPPQTHSQVSDVGHQPEETSQHEQSFPEPSLPGEPAEDVELPAKDAVRRDSPQNSSTSPSCDLPDLNDVLSSQLLSRSIQHVSSLASGASQALPDIGRNAVVVSTYDVAMAKLDARIEASDDIDSFDMGNLMQDDKETINMTLNTTEENNASDPNNDSEGEFAGSMTNEPPPPTRSRLRLHLAEEPPRSVPRLTKAKKVSTTEVTNTNESPMGTQDLPYVLSSSDGENLNIPSSDSEHGPTSSTSIKRRGLRSSRLTSLNAHGRGYTKNISQMLAEDMKIMQGLITEGKEEAMDFDYEDSESEGDRVRKRRKRVRR